MHSEIKKASLWKRIGAGLLDLIMVVILATGVATMLSSAMNFDKHYDEYEIIYNSYVEKYGILSDEEVNAMSPEEQEAYIENCVKPADEAIVKDEKAQTVYGKIVNLTLIMVSGAVLIAILLLEFAVPLLFGNGQTVGKKIFSLCLVRNDGVKANNLQIFARTLLGKYAVETMIPLYTAIMLLAGQANPVFMLIVLILFIVQVILLGINRNHCLLHDLMVGTVVVDYSTQHIFSSAEELVSYKEKIAAERAARQPY